MSEREKQVGLKAKAFRESAMLSQQDLATKMRAAGFKWSQATVWNVENGDRNLRLSEAEQLAHLCNAEPSEFFAQQPKVSSTTAGVALSIRTLQALLREGPHEEYTATENALAWLIDGKA